MYGVSDCFPLTCEIQSLIGVARVLRSKGGVACLGGDEELLDNECSLLNLKTLECFFLVKDPLSFELFSFEDFIFYGIIHFTSNNLLHIVFVVLVGISIFPPLSARNGTLIFPLCNNFDTIFRPIFASKFHKSNASGISHRLADFISVTVFTARRSF